MASLYLHIPYCERKCIYCDFYSIENMESKERFLSALKKEIVMRGEEFADKETFETIFFGGGTPTLLSPKQMDELLSLLHKTFHITSNAEITSEANPGTVDVEKLRGYKTAGFNRMSFGIQSFHKDELEFLSRIHNAEEAERAIHNAYEAGFENVSCDLIFSLPNQTPEKWKETLLRAIALKPKHISAYSLIVEENTPLSVMVKNKIVSPLPEEIDAEIYESTMEILSQHGFMQYEISNYALPGYESRHNKNYWNHENYLGFGPSAHSFWRKEKSQGKRWWNARNIQGYCEAIEAGKFPLSGSEIVDRKTLLNEEIFLGLRSGGIRLDIVKNDFDVDILALHNSIITEYGEQGLLTIQENLLKLTSKGYVLCDAIAERLME